MNTKEKILDAALTLFSEHGYTNVFVAQIAEAVGIKAPSLYKHYKSKRDIFNGIKTKGFFAIMAMMQKNGFNPPDKEYWIAKGWTKGKRPWK